MTQARSSVPPLPFAQAQPAALDPARAGQFGVAEIYEPTSGQHHEDHRDEHLLCMSLMPCPVELWQVHNSRRDYGVHRKGDIVLVPAGSTQWRWEGEDRYLSIRFRTQFFQQVALEALETQLSHIQPNFQFLLRDPQLQQIALLLHQELQTGGWGGQIYQASLVNALMIHLLRHHSTAAPRPFSGEGLPEYQLRQVLDYLQDVLDQDIKLTDLANLLNMSQFHFSRRFKQAMGVSPHQYLLTQRIERAKQLLKSSRLGIAEVAIQCGFNSQSHLGKYFRELTGVTPSQYRKT